MLATRTPKLTTAVQAAEAAALASAVMAVQAVTAAKGIFLEVTINALATVMVALVAKVEMLKAWETFTLMIMQ